MGSTRAREGVAVPAYAVIVLLLTACGARTTNESSSPGSEVEINPASLRFSKIVAANAQFCGITMPDMHVTCVAGDRVTLDRPGPYQDLSLSDEVGPAWTYACAVRLSGDLDCWGTPELTVPKGHFTKVSVGVFNACAVADDGSLHCWVPEDVGGTVVPNPSVMYLPKVATFSVSMWSACVAELLGHHRCFGRNGVEAPDELHLMSISLGVEKLACASALPDFGFWCWGAMPATKVLEGQFAMVSVAGTGQLGCGLTTDGDIRCWSRAPTGDGGAALPAAIGGPWIVDPRSDRGRSPFQSISVSSTQVCGLREDGTVACWKVMP